MTNTFPPGVIKELTQRHKRCQCQNKELNPGPPIALSPTGTYFLLEKVWATELIEEEMGRQRLWKIRNKVLWMTPVVPVQPSQFNFPLQILEQRIDFFR